MVELIRTNDPVLLSWLTAALAEARIEAIVLDVHTSILEGSVSAIPRRVMVDDDDLARAKRLVAVADRMAGGKDSD
ncbi:MAG: DUF2007 domain-containing protein [Rhodospirillales bacterium]|jgi:hypothetical protein|nr:DUF2007 domain-containing protein [Rhodospirillales bacterium]MDP6775077.1 DUF2007 domain-containing protein [Rhodospirillales bacterium]